MPLYFNHAAAAAAAACAYVSRRRKKCVLVMPCYVKLNFDAQRHDVIAVSSVQAFDDDNIVVIIIIIL